MNTHLIPLPPHGPHRLRAVLATAVVLVATPLGQETEAQQVTGEIELETRAFPRRPLSDDQRRNNVSLRFQPELY